MSTLRSTKKSEADEIAASHAALESARKEFDVARLAAAEAPAATAGRLSDVEDAEWVRVALAERRENEAFDAHARGERRRENGRRWRRLFGLPVEADPPSLRRATLSFLETAPAHSTEEDLHPHALDRAESNLSDALAQDALEKRIQEREARDA